MEIGTTKAFDIRIWVSGEVNLGVYPVRPATEKETSVNEKNVLFFDLEEGIFEVPPSETPISKAQVGRFSVACTVKACVQCFDQHGRLGLLGC
ncbi:hypothetical protein U1Q18_029007 [Sarracenia purpurea var. burkii]